MMPVNPPIVKRNKNPITQSWTLPNFRILPLNEATHLNTLMPVGTAIIIVAAVKYKRVSISIPTLNMW
jgi:hypothetical protein